MWVPKSQNPDPPPVDLDVTPDAVAHELLDILDIVDGWAGTSGE
jgi:putative hydrolase of the HAD superfamily